MLPSVNFNMRGEENSRHDPRFLYPEPEAVFLRARSISVQEEDGFEDLGLLDSMEAFRESSSMMVKDRMTDGIPIWDQELIRRGLDRDPLEPRDSVGELCLGYAGSIGVMALTHITRMEAQVSLPFCLTK